MIVKLFVFVFLTVFAKTEAKPKFAKCEFEEGVIFFREAKNATEIYGEIHGLTDGLHGIHVHQEGGLGNGCKDAGGHFDPDQTEDETGLYVGNLGSIESLDGLAMVEMEDSGLNVVSGPKKYRVINRAIVVHAEATGGARVMCCTIKKATKQEVQEYFSGQLDS